MSRFEKTTLFEVSWEVCNKVGGINTVLRSKAGSAVAEFNDNYYLLGPYLTSNTEFEETDEAEWHDLRRVLGEKGLDCRFGRWTIPARPKVILVRQDNRYNVEQLLYRLWESAGVDSIAGGWDYIEPVLFSTTCGEVISILAGQIFNGQDSQVVAQFHEWMTGAGLLYLKDHAADVATVFTTHATVLGRSMSGIGRNLYKEIDDIAPNEEAKQCNVVAKHSMESVSAREADTFTTVSEVTALEARKVLGRSPDAITENGMNVEDIDDYAANREPALASRKRLIEFAGSFLRKEIPESTRLVFISGRYEFINKGIDVFLAALAKVRGSMSADRHVVAFVCVLGGHHEFRKDAQKRESGLPLICTHRLPDENNDPILNACLKLGLTNQPSDNLDVLFIPNYLSENDGVLNMSYYDVLRGTDMTVFPSKYEPWGYTPMESAVCAVPTVTSDLAGFGAWVQARSDIPDDKGVFVLRRAEETDADVIADLAKILDSAFGWTDQDMMAQRRDARAVGEKAAWTDFYPKYVAAYERALRNAEKRALRREAIETGMVGHVLPARESTLPHFRTVMVEKRLPKALSRLRELAGNLWWSWNQRADELFARIDPYIWEQTKKNPIKLLDTVPSERLDELARTDSYLYMYQEVIEAFDNYRKDTKPSESLGRVNPLSWNRPVAYFSTEFGLHESLPLYSGGLGVLSGDHLKSSSDLKVPMIAVGLFYSHGYFTQRIAEDGSQVAEYGRNDVLSLPLKELKTEDDAPLTVSVDLPGRTLYASIWKLQVGRITVYLLHSDLPANTQQDRKITDQLYVGDERTRLEQEILLGIGGPRALRKLGVKPSVFHLNEGHSAFLILENVRFYMHDYGLSFDEAWEMSKSQTVFTTHTPVEAGNERFPRDLLQYYFASYLKDVGMTPERFFEFGRAEGGDRQPFIMTVLALKGACLTNGVSRLHGRVSRQMWEKVWSGVHQSMVPITSITNGVHAPSFIGPEMHALLDTYLGLNWDGQLPPPEKWERFDNIPDHLLWETKQEMKQSLINDVRDYVGQHWYGDQLREMNRDEVLARLRGSSLTIGFARRFAPYKRATLLFRDLDRLDRIVNNPRRPVQFLFAGKAHPKDQYGADLVKQVVQITRDKRFAGRIVFLEDYDLHIARQLVQGVDVWLNTPRRPFEASGTSGQKAAINAGINLSVADGWWYEGADEGNGWTIGRNAAEVDETSVSDDLQDAHDLYALLEDVVVPMYYQRNVRGLPEQWLATMKRSLATALPRFNTHRMVRDYVTQLYHPCAKRAMKAAANNFKMVRDLAEWKRRVASRFSSVHIMDIVTAGAAGGVIQSGSRFGITVRLDLGELMPNELLVELIIGQTDPDHDIRNPVEVQLHHDEAENGRIASFTGEYTVEEKGSYSYGIRIIPHHKDLAHKFDAGLVCWA